MVRRIPFSTDPQCRQVAAQKATFEVIQAEKEVANAVLERLHQADTCARSHVLDALTDFASLGSAQALKTIRHLYSEDEDSSIKLKAAQALGEVHQRRLQQGPQRPWHGLWDCESDMLCDRDTL